MSDHDWSRVVRAVQDHAGDTMFTEVTDPEFAGMSVADVAALLGPKTPTYALLVDDATLQDATTPVLVVKPDGTALRVAAQRLAEVADNLALANLSLEDYRALADSDGVLRTI